MLEREAAIQGQWLEEALGHAITEPSARVTSVM